MKAEELKGHLDGLLLAVLEPGPLHGYAVVQELHSRSAGAVELPTGTIYPGLHRLERAGLLRSEWVRTAGRRRRIYHLTTAGHSALTEQRQHWTEFVHAISGVLSPPRGEHAPA